MSKIEKATVKNFRKFEDFSIGDFSQINVITGGNNAGKTTILEFLVLLSSGETPTTLSMLSKLRKKRNPAKKLGEGDVDWENFFHNFNSDIPIEMSAENTEENWKLQIEYLEGRNKIIDSLKNLDKDVGNIQSSSGSIKALRLTYTQEEEKAYHLVVSENEGMIYNDGREPIIPGGFSDATVRNLSENEYEAFDEIQINKNKDILIEALSNIDSRIQDIVSGGEKDKKELYIDVGKDQLVNIEQMGGGIIQATEVILGLASCRKGIYFSDEIGQGIHQKAFEKFWNAVEKAAAEFDVQVFTNTHSYDCIEGLGDSNITDYKVYRIDSNSEDVVEYEPEELSRALESNFEVR